MFQKLKTLKIELLEDVFIHLVLNTFYSTQFNQFKISYNKQKEKLSFNQLISFCVQEEERLKENKIESAQLASTYKIRTKREKLIKLLSVQWKRNKIRMKIVASFVINLDMSKRNVLSTMPRGKRKVYSLLWLV